MATPTSARAWEARAVADKLHLLLVEDSPSDAMLLEAYLHEGFLGACVVERATTLKRGLARLAEGGVDAVLLDLGLPDSTGLDTFREIANSNPQVPVVIVSGLRDSSVAEEAVASGAQDYVLKDTATPKDLARAVTYAIGRQNVIDDVERARYAQLEAKDRFLSHVSHELRTPLAAAHQFLSLVADETVGPLEHEQRACLGVAMRNIQQLALMIDDLLVVGRIGSGSNGFACRVQRTNMAGLIDDCVAGFRRSAEDKGISLDVEMTSLAEALCDPVRATEVLSNLLENALKFTPHGGSVNVTAQSNDSEILVSVQDSGPGVRPENRDRVFEQFFQENGDDDSGRAGLGLGLYLCRELVARQGGRIWLDNDPASPGSKFFFTLPTSGSGPTERGDD